MFRKNICIPQAPRRMLHLLLSLLHHGRLLHIHPPPPTHQSFYVVGPFHLPLPQFHTQIPLSHCQKNRLEDEMTSLRACEECLSVPVANNKEEILILAGDKSSLTIWVHTSNVVYTKVQVAYLLCIHNTFLSSSFHFMIIWLIILIAMYIKNSRMRFTYYYNYVNDMRFTDYSSDQPVTQTI